MFRPYRGDETDHFNRILIIAKFSVKLFGLESIHTQLWRDNKDRGGYFMTTLEQVEKLRILTNVS